LIVHVADVDAFWIYLKDGDLIRRDHETPRGPDLAVFQQLHELLRGEEFSNTHI
jgi:hypothetical protein